MSSRPNTVYYRPRNQIGSRYDEGVCDTPNIQPGWLIMPTANAQSSYLVGQAPQSLVAPHNVRGGKAQRWIATEDTLFGDATMTHPLDRPYTAGNIVRFVRLLAGDQMYFRLKKGEVVALNDFLISYGDGTLCKAASAYLANITAASAGVTNTTVETTFSNGTATIKKLSVAVGDLIRIRAYGVASATHSTDTLTAKLKIGTTQLVTTGALDVANGDAFLIDFSILVEAIGATGSIVGFGTSSIGTPGTVTTKVVNLAATTVDFTVDEAITVTATWSVADVGNVVALQSFLVELVKAGSSPSSPAGGDIIGRAKEDLDLSVASADGWLITEVIGG